MERQHFLGWMYTANMIDIYYGDVGSQQAGVAKSSKFERQDLQDNFQKAGKLDATHMHPRRLCSIHSIRTFRVRHADIGPALSEVDRFPATRDRPGLE